VLFCERQAKGHDLLRQLPSHGVLSIFAEGGATVLGAFLDSGFADKVHVFVAPKVMGGTTSLSALGGAGSASMSEVRNLSNFTSQRCGEDLLLEGALTKWGA
jgi:diaminohydroxyphosphoribosylaminopyrimidine deaminase/5-amino-6-(5-phosphoribosylamino)uracil reductase